MDNGKDMTRAYLVTALCRVADGQVVDHPTLTRFLKALAETLGKAEMAASKGAARSEHRENSDFRRGADLLNCTAGFEIFGPLCSALKNRK